MSALGSPDSLLLAPSGYEIQRSLRFDSGSSAFLYRTPSSAGNQKKYTISVWVKRTALLASLFDVSFLGAGDGTNYGIAGTGAFGAAYDGHMFIRNGGANVGYWDIEFRDPSAWYHFVLAIDTDQGTAANRNRLYVNGVEQSAPTASLGSGVSTNINAASIHSIGTFNLPSSAVPYANYYTNAYLAEYNFIDGSQLDHTSFGETDTETGAWIPKKYGGSYGTNGFYLNFSDNSSVSALGTDTSGNGNNWTVSPNFSVTAGVGNDSLEDTPTNNWCTLNPISSNASATLANGNLDTPMQDNKANNGTIGVSSGKWYWEVTVNDNSSYCPYLGVTSYSQENDPDSSPTLNSSAARSVVRIGDPLTYKNYTASSTASGTNQGNYGTIGIALNLDAGEIKWYKNNSLIHTDTTIPTDGTTLFPYFGITSSGIGGWNSTNFNFGQRAFEYTPPTGFKALNTANLPVPTIKDGTDYFNTVLYTGNTTLRSISGVGFQPDFVWLKRRSSAAVHGLWDSVRGASNYLVSSSTDQEQNDTTNGLQDFETDGFELGPVATWNGNTETYVAWNWKESVDAGFDIVADTGTGAAKTVSHNLGVAPKVIIRKSRTSSTGHWYVYHYEEGATQAGILQLTNSFAASTAWNSTAPTSSVFSVGSNVDENKLNDNFISYLFAEVEGFSKFGSYTGNGGNNFIYCGFSPAWIMTKRDGSSNWYIFDPVREHNLMNSPLQANDPGGEPANYNNNMDILSNGFCLKSSDAGANGSGSTYVFMAFAETPFKYANAR